MEPTPDKRKGLLIGGAFIATLLSALVIGAFVAYHFIRTGYEGQLERRLKSYAATAANAFNPATLEQMIAEDERALEMYAERLQRARQASGVRRAAVLRRDGTLMFDTEGGVFGRRDYSFAADANELEASFSEGPQVTIMYFDDDGDAYRNAFAPIYYRDGGASDFAVGVELEADYTDQLSYVRLTMVLTVLGVFLVTAGAALAFNRAWSGLLRRLARQTRLAEQAQFSAGMAHQIKNPLAALRGYVELLSRQLSEPSQRQIADKLLSEIGALDRVVRDFLQFSRGAHGSVERLTLPQALRPVADAARTAGGASVAVEVAAQDVEIEVDSTALREALSNVAVNAAEAMRETGGELRLMAALAGRQVTIEISDSGPGISEDVKPRLFEPFVTGKADGTGLGLPIARRLLRDMGGELELVKTGPGGTVFKAEFPKNAPEA